MADKSARRPQTFPHSKSFWSGRLRAFGDGSRERRLERETGIEPATNSLEGCDSTTELLPPTRSPASPLRAPAGWPATDNPPSCLTAAIADAVVACWPPSSSGRPNRGLPTGARGREAPGSKAGGEGRIRTSEGRSRQIYSLLRLTASLPRRTSNAGLRGRQRSHVSAPIPGSAADGWVQGLCQECAAREFPEDFVGAGEGI